MTATSGKVARTRRERAERQIGEATSAKLRVWSRSGSTAWPTCSMIVIAMPCSNGHSAAGLARTAWLSSISISGLKVTTGSGIRSEEHTSELQSLMRISYAVFCLKKKKHKKKQHRQSKQEYKCKRISHN